MFTTLRISVTDLAKPKSGAPHLSFMLVGPRGEKQQGKTCGPLRKL